MTTIAEVKTAYERVGRWIDQTFPESETKPTVREYMRAAGPATPDNIRLALSMMAGKVAEVSHHRICQQCAINPAVADAASLRGWGYFCEGCFTDLGCKLGLGAGQVLFVVGGE